MVSPAIGPFTTTEVAGPPGSRVWYRYRRRWMQKFPIDQPLPYDNAIGYGSHAGLGANYDAVTAGSLMWDAIPYTDGFKSYLISKTYAKIKDQISDSAQLGVTLLEYRQSMSMITNRAIQLAKFTNHIRKGRLGDAAQALGMSRDAVKRDPSGKRTLANTWLEYHFGWEPLVKDIHDSLTVLGKPVKSFTFQASTSSKEMPFIGTKTGLIHSYAQWDGKYGCRMGGIVSVTNENLHIATTLGLTNPAAWAWELVPFSFVVDWFSNVGQVLDTMTDFFGLSLTKTYTTLFSKGNYYSYAFNPFWDPPSFRETSGSFSSVTRSLGLTLPAVHLKPFKGFSVIRGATAISLLVQQLVRLKG